MPRAGAFVSAALLFVAMLHGQSALAQQRSAAVDTTAATDSTATSPAGRFDRLDPQRSRLFLSSTARPIGSGEVYASGVWVFFVQAGVGIGDVFSLRGGALLLPNDDFGRLITATPKVTLLQVRTDALFDDVPLSVALDAQTMAERQASLYPRNEREHPLPPYRIEHEWDLATLPRVLATYGSPEAALTTGLGVPLGFAGDVVATVGGEVQLLEWFKLLSENEFYFGAERIDTMLSFDEETRSIQPSLHRASTTLVNFSGGGRFLWDHFALEATLAGATDLGFEHGEIDLVPLLRLSYRF